MDEQALTNLISKTAMLMEKFERNCTEIDQRQQALTQHLNDLTQKLPMVVRQSADSSLQTLPRELLGKVQSGLEEPVSQYEKRLSSAGTRVGEGSDALAQQLQRMHRTFDPAIDDDVIRVYLPGHAGLFADHQDAGRLAAGADIAHHFAIHAQTVLKG